MQEAPELTDNAAGNALETLVYSIGTVAFPVSLTSRVFKVTAKSVH